MRMTRSVDLNSNGPARANVGTSSARPNARRDKERPSGGWCQHKRPQGERTVANAGASFTDHSHLRHSTAKNSVLQTTPTPTTQILMRVATLVRLSAFAIAFAALAGCKRSSNKGQLEGTKWYSVAQVIEGQSAAEGLLQLEFGSDKTFKYQMGSSTFTGRYTIDSGDQVTLFYDKAVAGKTKHIQKIYLKGSELEIIDEAGTSRKFRRAS